jgi:hypothetical protein
MSSILTREHELLDRLSYVLLGGAASRKRAASCSPFIALVNPRDSAPNGNRDQGTSFVGIPMESEQKNAYLFYFIITLILLGFIASLALPLKAQEHRAVSIGFAGWSS